MPQISFADGIRMESAAGNFNAVQQLEAARDVVRAYIKNDGLWLENLQSDLELGNIDGWTEVVQKHKLNFSNWSGAMQRAINHIRGLNN